MGLFARLLDMVRTKPARSAGARGLLESHRRNQEKKDRDAEDERQSDPVYRFVYLGEEQHSPHSSNVASAWYELSENALYVHFDDDSLYRYDPVSPAEAESYWRASSKGIWVWDNLRIRGTKLGHRKEYALVHSGRKARRWEASPQAALNHSQKVASQSGAKTPFEKLGKFARKRPRGN